MPGKNTNAKQDDMVHAQYEAHHSDIKEKINKVLEKYDQGSNTRKWTGVRELIINLFLAAFAIYSVLINFIFHFDTRINRASFTGAVVVFVYLLYPARKDRAVKENHMPWYDILLCAGGGFAYFWFVFHASEIINKGLNIGPFLLILGVIGIIATLEACRRAVGLPIVIVATSFIIYGLVYRFTRNPNLFAMLNRNVYDLFYTTDGIIGTPIRACQTFIVLFVIFGSFLERTGISDFFIQFANSVAGGSSGGPAKVAVISSALCGMVSGSSVGNTVTTGAITIPLMKKNGYKGEFAGAVEAAASTGGQIMPPIMGAAAFLMIEYTNQKYSFIALRACLPALLYFAGIFISVHLEAKKLGLKGLSKRELPKLTNILKDSWYLVFPLIILVYLIINYTLPLAAVVATVAAIIVAIITDAKKYFASPKKVDVTTALATYTKHFVYEDFLTKDTSEMSLYKIFTGLVAGAKSATTVGVACSAAGIIACIITSTGIGQILISGIVSVSSIVSHPQGQLLIAMFLTMITCIVLGMGVPTTANYVIMATTCAPILTEMGMNNFAAHMFVFYFGIVADITPPVALAAYAGAAIAEAKPMKTAINASLLAIAAFIVPYIFGLNPALLFINTNIFEVITIVITSLAGMFGVAAGIRGFALAPVGRIERAILIFGGLLLIYPGLESDVIGLTCVFGVLFLSKIIKRKTKKEV